MNVQEFKKELRGLLNKFNKDNKCIIVYLEAEPRIISHPVGEDKVASYSTIIKID